MLSRKIFTALLMLGFAVSAAAELRVTSVESGLFKHRDREPDTIVLSSTLEEITPTKKIVAQLGTKFGVRYTLSGKKESNNLVTLLYLTPGVVHPNGERHDKYTEVKDLRASAGSHKIAFQITDDYELVPGIWEMMVFEEDRLLLRETFNVILKGTETLSEFK